MWSLPLRVVPTKAVTVPAVPVADRQEKVEKQPRPSRTYKE